MEDLSRFSGPVRGSTRLADYRARLSQLGTPAAMGLAKAFERTATPVQSVNAMPAAELAGNMTGKQRAEIGTALAKQGIAPARSKASNNPSQDRVKFVANAVATDPACKGKAATAIKMLADPDYADVSASGIVKLLKAGASADAPTAQSVAEMRDKAMRAEMRAAINSTGNSGIAPDGGSGAKRANGGGSWSRVIAAINTRNGFKAEASSAAGSGGSWGGAIAKMNRLNGFK